VEEDFYKVNENAFDDALDLLQNQGDVFIDADLIFLRPQFVTELLRPLIDHKLTLEKLNTRDSDLMDEITTYMRGQHESDSDFGPLIFGLNEACQSGRVDEGCFAFFYGEGPTEES
jgi:hypothetical protein